MKKPADLKSPKAIAIVCVILGVITAIVAITYAISMPQRTVANFCKASSESRMYFKKTSTDQDILDGFRAIERVSPEEIADDTKQVVKGYEIILDDPSKKNETQMGLAKTILRVDSFVTKNCPDLDN